MFKRLSLTKEIVFITLLKLALLYGLWWICFSTPVSKQQLKTKITAHLFSSSSTPTQLPKGSS